MREIKKKIAHWLVPPGFQIFFLNLRATQIFQDNYCKKNVGLKNIHRNERCFILATGPSIKKQDLKVLKDENCIAVSNFFVHRDYSTIKPKYYCIAPYHSPITEEAWQNFMAELDRGTEDEKLFFGLSDRIRNLKNCHFADRDVFFLNFGGSWDNTIHLEIDISHKIPGPQSVTIMALYIAIYMGFKEIYLLGCDHDWILHYGKSVHFYNENNHALVNCGYNEFEGYDLEIELECNLNLWRQYKYLKKIAENKRLKIYNATQGGLLDVFPRIQYETLFKS
jgi:hypothetical protein